MSVVNGSFGHGLIVLNNSVAIPHIYRLLVSFVCSFHDKVYEFCFSAFDELLYHFYHFK